MKSENGNIKREFCFEEIDCNQAKIDLDKDIVNEMLRLTSHKLLVTIGGTFMGLE